MVLIGKNVWGPALWKALEYIAMGYPMEPTDEQKEDYRNYFNNFYKVIPCSICSNHYQEHLKTFPLSDMVMQSRHSLVDWLIAVHNEVNKMNNKPQLSREDAMKQIEINLSTENHVHQNHQHEFFENVDNVESKPNKQVKSMDNTILLIVVLAALVTIAIIYKRRF